MARTAKKKLPATTNGSPVKVSKTKEVVDVEGMIRVELPIRDTEVGGYLDELLPNRALHRVFSVRMTIKQREGFRRFARGVILANARLEDGRPVENRSQAIQYLFEQFANAEILQVDKSA